VAATAAPCDMPCRSSVASLGELLPAAPYTPRAVACHPWRRGQHEVACEDQGDAESSLGDAKSSLGD
jgi:hypothetical protein